MCVLKLKMLKDQPRYSPLDRLLPKCVCDPAFHLSRVPMNMNVLAHVCPPAWILSHTDAPPTCTHTHTFHISMNTHTQAHFHTYTALHTHTVHMHTHRHTHTHAWECSLIHRHRCTHRHTCIHIGHILAVKPETLAWCSSFSL